MAELPENIIADNLPGILCSARVLNPTVLVKSLLFIKLVFGSPGLNCEAPGISYLRMMPKIPCIQKGKSK